MKEEANLLIEMCECGCKEFVFDSYFNEWYCSQCNFKRPTTKQPNNDHPVKAEEREKLEKERNILLDLQANRRRFFSQEEFDRLQYLSNILFKDAGSPFKTKEDNDIDKLAEDYAYKNSTTIAKGFSKNGFIAGYKAASANIEMIRQANVQLAQRNKELSDKLDNSDAEIFDYHALVEKMEEMIEHYRKWDESIAAYLHVHRMGATKELSEKGAGIMAEIQKIKEKLKP